MTHMIIWRPVQTHSSSLVTAKMRLARRLLVALLWGTGFATAVAYASGASPVAQPRLGGRSVAVYRDSYGMAHLYAGREEDAFYGLGYAIAEDRLLQVLTWFVATRGELAATFGPTTPRLSGSGSSNNSRANDSPTYGSVHDAIRSDMAVRKYMLLAKARQNLTRLPPQFQKDLRGYVEGLAAYMRDHPERTPAWAPRLEPALPLALYHLQVWEQQTVCDERREAERAAASPEKSVWFKSAAAHLSFGASNAWAVAGSRTADGRVIMSSDSHGPIEGDGTTFYPYRIKAGALDIVAFDRPGTLQFLFGHSPHFAWGITEGPRFVADCYRVKVNPKSPRTFAYDGITKSMTAVPYRIRVKGAATITGMFEYTHHNNVLSTVDAREGDTAYVVSYAYAERIGLGAGEGYRMALARTRGELDAALSQRDAYPANLIIGGEDGTIMYVRPGRVPIRPPGVDVRYTLDGNSSATAWRGIHPYEDLLKLVNPPQGYVSNSNISPDMMYPTPLLRPADYPDYFAFEPGYTGTRQQRLIELLDNAAGLSVEGAKAITMDETIAAARPWGPMIAQTLADRVDLFGDRFKELRPFLAELARFNGELSKDSKGALYHEALRRALHDHHPSDMDALQEDVESGHLRRDQQDVLIQAAEEARQAILADYGRVDLTWGDVHRVTRGDVDLPIGGGVVVLGISHGGWPWHSDYLGVEQPARSATTPRALTFSIDPVTKIQHLIDGQRIPFLVHFAADGVQSYAQTLWGVSDDPASPHYADQCRLASDKILRPIPLSLTALARDRASESLLTIKRH